MRPLLLLLFAGCTGKPGDTSDPGGEPDDTADTADSGAPDTGWDPRFDAFVAQLESDLAASDAPGVSVAILQDGEIVFARGFGSKRPDADEPVADTTLFQIGSTTKMLTAMALLQQVEAGAYALDGTLYEALPGLEFTVTGEWAAQVELRHLLSHQGGFYDYIDWSGSSDDGDLETWMMSLYPENLWLMSPPGAFWNYSNPNFNYAGLLVEREAGQPYPDHMREALFAPLGMDRTFQRKAEAEADGDYALGVGIIDPAAGTYGDVLMGDVPDPAASRPAGSSTWTTPTQMMEIARLLLEGDPSVLADEHREALTASQVSLLITPDNAGYGYGMFVYPGFNLADGYYAAPLWEHGGNTLSYTSMFTILPEQGFAICILSSGYGTDFSSSVGVALSTLVEGLPEPTTAPDYTFDPADLDAHVGTYSDAYNVGDIIITRVGDSLHVAMPFLEELGYVVAPELETVSSDVFYLNLDGYWYDLTFIDGEDGTDSKYIRNRAFVGVRSEGEAEPPPFAPGALRHRLVESRLSAVPLYLPAPPAPAPLAIDINNGF